MCCRPVAVQFGVKIFILAVHFNSFSVGVNGAVEILLVIFIVTFVLVNLCNCYNEVNEINLGIPNFRLNKNCVIVAVLCSKFSPCFNHDPFLKLCNCMFCFLNSHHVMFSREFAFCLFINYAHIGTWMHVHMTKFEKNSSLGYHHVV